MIAYVRGSGTGKQRWRRTGVDVVTSQRMRNWLIRCVSFCQAVVEVISILSDSLSLCKPTPTVIVAGGDKK